MSKAERTKVFIIEKCAPIFNKKGYAGTSLTDIVEATGLTKGAIYGNFKDKDEIAIEAYLHNVGRMKNRYIEYMEGEKDCYGKLISFAKFYKDWWKNTSERGGCPILNASIEADDNCDFLKPYVQNSIKKWAFMLSMIIEEGQKKKEFKSSVNATEYAYTIITLVEGGVMLSKIMDNKKLLVSALDRMVSIIDEELKK